VSRRDDVVAGFPTARIRSYSGGLPVEVVLLAQLGHGAGDRLHHDAGALQRGHDGFVDELDEPSVRVAAPDFDAGERSALYTFAVGAAGHPFHRHAGHRVFTAISGSAGARLRFSTASDAQLERDPAHFAAALHHVEVPPDCLFTVRFGGGTWHQFAPLQAGSPHPVLFALSCHTDETGGLHAGELRDQVLAGGATIATLTETLPAQVQAWLATHPLERREVPTMRLSLHAPPGSWQQGLCTTLRRMVGRLRAHLPTGDGFVEGRAPRVRALPSPSEGSLLLAQIPDFHHQDTFVLRLQGEVATGANAATLLAELLDGFLQHRPAGVTRLMRLRNMLVRPLQLRTSPLGCPVSSLLSGDRSQLFAGRHPVLAQQTDGDDRRAQVVLGADDRHLVFRSCVGVQITPAGVEISLGTRVRCRNAFGHLYMALITGAHRTYIVPAMLRMATESLPRRHALSPAQGLFA
jgi:hypothetical protein